MTDIPYVYVVTDNTGSMGAACSASRTSTAEVRATANLFLGKERVLAGVVGDYDVSTPDHQYGGVSFLDPLTTDAECTTWFTKYMKPNGGGGVPEAYRTLFNMLLKREPGIVFLFCDAGPHGVSTDGRAQSDLPLDREGQLEKAFIKDSSMIWDWDELAIAVKKAGFKVVTFLTGGHQEYIGTYTKMGDVVMVPQNTAPAITKTMLTVLYAMLNQPQDQSIVYHYLPEGTGMNRAVLTRRDIIPAVQLDLLAAMRQADPDFVLRSFDYLLNPDRPESAISLTTSPILGKYWRNLICGTIRFIDDGKYADRAQAVMDKLSKCTERLNATDKSTMKKWIEESHDDTAICRQLVGKACDQLVGTALDQLVGTALDQLVGKALDPDSGSGPGLFLKLPNESKNSISLDDVLQLGRGGDFSVLANLIASMQLSTESQHRLPENPEISPDFIPLTGLKPSETFRLLGNLLKPGFMFSQTVAYFAAILALNNRYLKPMAYSFLEQAKGSWIKWDLDIDGSPKFPAFWPLNFMRLLGLVPDELLTSEEREFRDKYRLVAVVNRNHNAVIEMTVPLILGKLRQDVTWKRLCDPAKGGCGSSRCFSIFPANSEVCGHCIVVSPSYVHYNQVLHDHTIRGTELDPSKIKECSETQTHWAQCYTCKGNYGVTSTENLKVRPKCHDCRLGQKPELVECRSCLHKYLSPGGSAMKAMGDFMVSHGDVETEKGGFLCPRCFIHPQDMVGVVEVKLSSLIAENPQLKNLVPVKPYSVLTDSSTKLWKRVLSLETVQLDSETSRDEIGGLTYSGYTVHNYRSVVDKFCDTLFNHSGQNTCQMCIEDRPVRDMVPACGHCSNRICQTCVTGWYGQVIVGESVAEGHTKCPFCKSNPKYSVVKGLAHCHLRNLRPTRANCGVTCPWDHRTIYAACTQCLNVQPTLPRECAEAAPEIRNFVCESCQDAARRAIVSQAEDYVTPTKDCPNCKIRTEKTGGCNHLSCVCGTHWCWSCGQGAGDDGVAFNSHSIYGHMSRCGGVFPGDGGGGAANYEDDDSDRDW